MVKCAEHEKIDVEISYQQAKKKHPYRPTTEGYNMTELGGGLKSTVIYTFVNVGVDADSIAKLSKLYLILFVNFGRGCVLKHR